MKSSWITAVFIGVIVVGGLAYVFLRDGEAPQLGRESAEQAVAEPAAEAETQPAPDGTDTAPAETAADDAASDAAESPTAEAQDSDGDAEAPQTAGAEQAESQTADPGAASGDTATAGSTGAGEPGSTAGSEPVSEDSVSTAATTEAPEASEETASASAPGTTQPDTTAGSTESSADSAQVAARSDATEAETPPGPTFDVVRVERTGEAVIAGWAPPGSRVTLFEGANALGSVTADASGNWVLLPDAPLEVGSRELYLTAKTQGGKLVESADSVVIVVPGAAPSASDQPAASAVADAAGDASDDTARQVAEDTLQDAATETAGTAAEATQTAEAVRDAAREAAGGADDSATAAAQPSAVSEDTLSDGDAETASGTTAAPASEQGGAVAVLVPRQGQGASRILQEPTADEGIADQNLVLNAIDYDQSGRVVISGRALPDRRILVYLDNALVGQTTADAQSRWVVIPAERINPGLHRLRVDQVDASGTVVARVETPFSRAESLTDLPGENFVIVQPGNSLWRIARKTYGDGFRYSLIYRSNAEQIRDPDLIYPGQVFLVPGSEEAPVN